ncbi:hypothetical protein BDV97DRAFT_130896 [Delphinella strobiligena]|nr:hypothetical protein BDV97DRAFT_130896 [Delphinella strobiligena]
MSTIAENYRNRKRKRLTFACNACRSRKVRCDDGHPKCTKCARAGIECITIDPRQPGSVVLRREAQQPSTLPRITPSTTNRTSVSGDQCSPASLLNPSVAVSQSVSGNEVPTEGYEIAQPHDIHGSPQSVTPGPTDNAPLPTWPRFMSGNNLQVMSQWLDLAFARIGVRHGFSSCHNSGAPDRKVSRLSPFALSSLSTHDSPEIPGFAQMFLSSANTFFPVFEERVTHQILNQYNAATVQASLEPYPCSETAIPILMIAVANLFGEADTEEALKHIRAAYSMLSIIVVESSLRSTQALFLLALALRAFNEIYMAWHLITLGISIAQSLAMHRAYTAQ